MGNGSSLKHCRKRCTGGPEVIFVRTICSVMYSRLRTDEVEKMIAKCWLMQSLPGPHWMSCTTLKHVCRKCTVMLTVCACEGQCVFMKGLFRVLIDWFLGLLSPTFTYTSIKLLCMNSNILKPNIDLGGLSTFSCKAWINLNSPIFNDVISCFQGQKISCRSEVS